MSEGEMPFDDEVYDWIPKDKPKYYELHRLDVKFSNKVALISMICFLKQAYDKKGVKMTFPELVYKLADNTSQPLRAELADICTAFYSEPYDFDNYGFKSAKEIKTEINKILNWELPF
jgi:hypothetical protein